MHRVDSLEELDDFLIREVVPVYDACKADPSRLLTAEQMQDALDEWDRADGLPVRPREGLLKQSA